jgi:hypothetical protein
MLKWLPCRQTVSFFFKECLIFNTCVSTTVVFRAVTPCILAGHNCGEHCSRRLFRTSNTRAWLYRMGLKWKLKPTGPTGGGGGGADNLLSILYRYRHYWVGITTRYGLDGVGIESSWGWCFSAPVQTGSGAHPASYAMGTGSLSRGKSGRGVAMTTNPHLAPRLKKVWTCTSTPHLGLRDLFWGELYLHIVP